MRKLPFDYCLKQPMILDGQHHLAQLFVTFIHNSNCHTRLKQTQHILQLEFWILNTGSIIKKVIRCCYDCRRQDAYATYPEMSELPPYHFPADQPFPFQQTGLDVFGRFASKTPSQTYDKRYGLILTCQTTRAVYIEMCHNLSLDATMTTLCRFLHAVVNHTC